MLSSEYKMDSVKERFTVPPVLLYWSSRARMDISAVEIPGSNACLPD